MDIGKLKNGIEVWIEGFAGDPGTRVKVRHVNQDEFDRIVKKTTVTTFDPKTRQKTETLDDAAYRKELVNAVVVDWSGFEMDGKPWPCTQENREWLMEISTDFRALVREVPLSLERMLDLDREQQEKNC